MSQSLINYGNADKIETQTQYPEFFATIRNHRAWTLHLEFDASLRDYEANRTNPRSPKVILNEYKKEKVKLMKELQQFKHLSKQMGVVIDRVMSEHFIYTE
jgi:hypothetical protein